MSVHIRGLRPVVHLAAIFTLTVAAAGAAQAQQKTDVIFSAGPTGGSWTPMAAAASQVVNKRYPELNVQVEPGAALVNMEKIRSDKADIGWSMTTVMADAQKGEGQFAGKATDKALFVANFYPNVWQLVVPANSDIKSVKDLKGQPVALPARGNTSLAAGWEYLLKVNGMTLNDLGAKSYGPVSSNAEAVKNRQAMAAGWFTVVPASFVLDLGSAMPLRVLPVSDEEFAALRKLNSGFVRYTIKAGTYKDQGVTDAVQTFQSPTVLIASSKTSPEVIYKITKAIVEGRDEFGNVTSEMKGVKASDMAESLGMPYHPGAEKYYREAGLLKQ
ncbi:TAXI family TRAP transporter solute-binding subunit [Bradyrhizobium sp. sGM-13]|uniref:TAXI family TRAP transporter solute-binding subunit n=1 Tax=Bradyrhizobium sp. sGM-13 TaxID=2831781 RepID=UPI001BCD3C14|nr:TAXI family TRAP transporter solute-binding subunit [Bradyrhizobium sp. sGM-13]